MADSFIEKKIRLFFKFISNTFDTFKGKIELEKMKFDLKKKYINLGNYVAFKSENDSMSDFSHDESYMNKINDILKLKLYIKNQTRIK